MGFGQTTRRHTYSSEWESKRVKCGCCHPRAFPVSARRTFAFPLQAHTTALLHCSTATDLNISPMQGRRLCEFSTGPDSFLMCGSGSICAAAGARVSLRSAGWNYLLPVILISAQHLDEPKTKRHTSVFTKFHAFCLAHEQVLLLDVNLPK